MSIQIIRIAGVIIGGTLGGYISSKIGEYINNKNKKIQEIDNSIEINQIPVSSTDDKKKIKSFEDLLQKEIKVQSEQDLIIKNNNSSIETETDNYYQNYLKALEDENKKLKEKEMLFINDSIYDNDFYDYILLISK
jgi:hypothetical protein